MDRWSLVRSTVLTALLASCAGVPGTSPSYRVVSAVAIGPLLEIQLEWTSRAAAVSSDARRSLLFVASEECR